MSHSSSFTLTPAGEEVYFESHASATRDLDPDYNFSAAGNCSLTKYYIDTDINEIIKSNNDYTCGFSFLHLNTRSLTFSKFNNYLSLIDIKFFCHGINRNMVKQ